MAGHWRDCRWTAQLLQRLTAELRACGDHRGDHSGWPAELRRREPEDLLRFPGAEPVSFPADPRDWPRPSPSPPTTVLTDRRAARPAGGHSVLAACPGPGALATGPAQASAKSPCSPVGVLVVPARVGLARIRLARVGLRRIAAGRCAGHPAAPHRPCGDPADQ